MSDSDVIQRVEDHYNFRFVILIALLLTTTTLALPYSTLVHSMAGINSDTTLTARVFPTMPRVRAVVEEKIQIPIKGHERVRSRRHNCSYDKNACATTDRLERAMRAMRRHSKREYTSDSVDDVERMPSAEAPHEEESCGSALLEQYEQLIATPVVLNGSVIKTTARARGAILDEQNIEIPFCGQGVCDNPAVRDHEQYWKPANRTINLDWLVYGDTLPDSTERITQLTEELNYYYAPAGFTFASTILRYSFMAEGSQTPFPNVTVGYPACGQTFYGDALCVEAEQVIMAIRGTADWQNTVRAFQVVVTPEFAERRQVLGFAMYPWMERHGLVAMANRAISPGRSTLRHELGHALGLYHTFRGIAETDSTGGCPVNGGRCYESEASDYTGDLCSDTNPHPRSWDCADPDVIENPDPCNQNRRVWRNTPFNNIMSYGRDECRQEFTSQQLRRMRCWVTHFRYAFAS